MKNVIKSVVRIEIVKKFILVFCRYEVSSPARVQTGRASIASLQYSRLSTPRAWSISHLHRAILAIDEQARKDYAAGYLMSALSAWQNALVFCDELSQRNQLWPENVSSFLN